MNKLIQYLLGSILLVVALNAFGGGYYGLSGAKDVPTEWLKGTPFKSYFIPALILFMVVGGSSLVASIGVFRKKAWAKKAALAAGGIMLAWILVQVTMIGYVSWLQPAIAICGIVTLLLAYSIPLKNSRIK